MARKLNIRIYRPRGWSAYLIDIITQRKRLTRPLSCFIADRKWNGLK